MPRGAKTKWHSAVVRRKTAFAKKPWATIPLSESVNLVTGKLKGRARKKDPMIAQSFRFHMDDFTPAQAKAWIKKHKEKFIQFEKATATSTKRGTKRKLRGVDLDMEGQKYHCYVYKKTKRVYCRQL